MDKNYSLFEFLAEYLGGKIRKYALPLVSALVFGLLAHGYAFTNKLLNADEISALFTKGATITSGRWGLVLSSYVLPDYSMPWIFGLISLVLIACAACLIVSVFEIKRPLLQAALAGAILSFPALVGNFSFMFTSSAYAVAILCAAASVWFFEKGGRIRRVLSVLLLALAMGIYQAYLSVASGLFVLLMLKRLMDDDSSVKEVILKGLSYVAMLLISLGFYYAVTYVVELCSESGYQEYEVYAKAGFFKSLRLAYTSFIRSFTDGYFGFVNSKLSAAVHVLLGAGSVLGLLRCLTARKQGLKLVLGLVLLAIFPLSLNCIYLIASVDIIHSLVLFSFICVYVLAAMVADRVELGRHICLRDVSALALAVIIMGNIFYANKIYLKMQLQYENAYAFYNTLMAQIMDTPGFEEGTVIDFVGNDASGIKVFEEIDSSQLTGPNDELVNIYTRVDFIRHYLGLDLYAYMEDIIYADWFYELPSYPDEGSIIMRPGEPRIIIKFS